VAETIAYCAGFTDHTKCATTANGNHGYWASCKGGGKGTNPDACNFFSSLYWLGDANAYEKALAERGVPFDTEIDRVSVKDVLNLLGEKREREREREREKMRVAATPFTGSPCFPVSLFLHWCTCSAFL
jgi:hypothetical protein